MGHRFTEMLYRHGACTEIDHSKDLLYLKMVWLYMQTLFPNVVLSQVLGCHANALLEDLPFVQPHRLRWRIHSYFSFICNYKN